MPTIDVPEHYGLTLLAGVVAPFFTSLFLGGPVMAARKAFSVPYPNMYATPGHHKDADAFNRVQRGHQSMFESMGAVQLMTLVGGLSYPRVAAGGAIAYCVGSYLFLQGYADTKLDVSMARYKKGGSLKWVGILTALVTCCVTCYRSR